MCVWGGGGGGVRVCWAGRCACDKAPTITPFSLCMCVCVPVVSGEPGAGAVGGLAGVGGDQQCVPPTGGRRGGHEAAGQLRHEAHRRPVLSSGGVGAVPGHQGAGPSGTGTAHGPGLCGPHRGTCSRDIWCVIEACSVV